MAVVAHHLPGAYRVYLRAYAAAGFADLIEYGAVDVNLHIDSMAVDAAAAAALGLRDFRHGDGEIRSFSEFENTIGKLLDMPVEPAL